jgi:3-hydroxymyristoyl/3-hydroxydecanoyl-(acyl carrier protein) dehydratase
MNPPGTMQHYLLFYQMLMMFPRFHKRYVGYMNGDFQGGMQELDFRLKCSGIEMGMIEIVNTMAREKLGLSPDIVTGASLGEYASLFSYGGLTFGEGDIKIGNIRKLMEALLEVYTYSDEKIEPMYCKAPLEDIKRAAAKVPGVFVSVTASPKGAFIAGVRENVRRVVEEGGFLAWSLTDNLSIHTSIVDHLFEPVYEAALNSGFRLREDKGFEIYSTYFKKAVGSTYEDFAEHAASILIKNCDFYGLLEHLYAKNARIFVDMGTGGTCLEWARETFEDREALVFHIYPPILDPVGSLFRLFSKLLSNNVNFNNEVFADSFMHPFMEDAAYPYMTDAERPVGDDALQTPVAGTVHPSAEVIAPSMAGGMKQAVTGYAASTAPVAAVAAPAADKIAPPASAGIIAMPAAGDIAQTEADGGAPSHAADFKTAPATGNIAKASGMIGRALGNNLRAYEIYVENSRLLLERLINSLKRKTPVSNRGDVFAKSDAPSAGAHRADKNKPRPLWDFEQILEITNGAPSKVWGKRYEALDSLSVRARMPLPPYLFVHRVVGLDAEFGRFRPSWIEYETDITDDCVMLKSENAITSIMLAESSHVAILLLSYIGIDLIYGKGVGYRILNTSENFHGDLPIRGDTVRSKLEFTEFIKSGTVTLVKSKFSCCHDEKLIVTIDLLGGFFTEADLADNNGILPVKKAGIKPAKQTFSNLRQLAEPITDLAGLYDGKYGPMMYPSRKSKKAERFYINPKLRMLDRIISMDLTGGDYGLGLIVAEKDIDANHWAFKVHFKNDPVFPGTLLSETTSHLQFLFAVNAGFLDLNGEYFHPCKTEHTVKSVFRGEIKPMASTIKFVQQFKEITETNNRINIISDCDVYWQGKHVSRIEGSCMVIEEIIK